LTKLDILVFAAHPDDAELSCGGTIVAHIAQGKKVGMIDFTRGELGTRGTAETRTQESAVSSQILGLTLRKNAEFADGFFVNDKAHQLKLMAYIRAYQPEIVLANAIHDRHIDHSRAAKLAIDACFLSGLTKIHTYSEDGKPQQAWRPKALYHYIQDYYIEPHLIVDVSDFWDTKLQAIKAFKTQFYDPNSDEPETPISTLDFIGFLEGRGREMGRMIGVKYGEGFTKATPVGTKNLFDIL
jgi:N-acetylglucosamine malate deacetylase 1